MRRGRIFCLVILALCLASVLWDVQPSRAATGAIAGQVTETGSGLPLGSIEVWAFHENGMKAGGHFGSVYTDGTGNYLIDNLPSGNYYVLFTDVSYDDQWFAGRVKPGSADVVAVTAPGTRTGIDAILTPVGSITGTVTDGTNPLDGIAVYAYDIRTGLYAGSASTGFDGTYDIRWVESGFYKLLFVQFLGGGHQLREWYPEAKDWWSAQPVTVASPGVTPQINAVFSEKGSISGTVTDTGGAPVASAWVYAAPTRPDPLRGFNEMLHEEFFYRGAFTDAAGAYRIENLETGTYSVIFSDDIFGDPVGAYDSKQPGCADRVAVTAPNETTGIDGRMGSPSTAGTIKGLVTDGTDPIHSVQVEAVVKGHCRGAATGQVFRGATGLDGRYEIVGLPACDYTLFFDHYGIGYAYEYYNDHRLRSQADVVTVHRGGSVTADVVLSPGGSIAGTVNADLPMISVYDADGAMVSSVLSWFGEYTVNDLPPGDYYVRFDDLRTDRVEDSYLPEYYDDASSLENATAVHVTAPGTATGVDAVLALEGGAISGIVTDDVGLLPNVEVTLYGDDESTPYAMLGNGTVVSDVKTNERGKYRFSGLAPGNYRIQFRRRHEEHNQVLTGEPIDMRWNGNAASFSLAPPVTVVAGQETAGVDARMGPPYVQAILAGRVTPLEGGCGLNPGPMVQAYPLDAQSDDDYQGAGAYFGEWDQDAKYFTGRVWADGSYAIFAPPGTYNLFLEPLETFRPRWFDSDQPCFTGARAVTAAAGQVTAGLDFTLVPSGTIMAPDIVAGGMDRAVTVSPGDDVPLKLSYDCSDLAGAEGDWWLVAFTPFPAPHNMYHFEVGEGWQPGLAPSRQGPCLNFADRKAITLRGLPRGSYRLFLAFDDIMDGWPNLTSIGLDCVDVHVTP